MPEPLDPRENPKVLTVEDLEKAALGKVDSSSPPSESGGGGGGGKSIRDSWGPWSNSIAKKDHIENRTHAKDVLKIV